MNCRLEEYTPSDKWIGAREINGKPVESKDALAELLYDYYYFFHEEEVPFVIREHERKFQYGVSHCTIWRRKK